LGWVSAAVFVLGKLAYAALVAVYHQSVNNAAWPD